MSLLKADDANFQNILQLYKTLSAPKPAVGSTVGPVIDERQKLDSSFHQLFWPNPNVSRNDQSGNSVIADLSNRLASLDWRIVRREHPFIEQFMRLSAEIACSTVQPPCIEGEVHVYSPTLLNPIDRHENVSVEVSYCHSTLDVEISIDASVEHLLHHCLVNFYVDSPAELCLLRVQGFLELLPKEAHLNELSVVQYCLRFGTSLRLELIVLKKPLVSGDELCRMIPVDKIRSPSDSRPKGERLSDKVTIIIEAISSECRSIGRLYDSFEASCTTQNGFNALSNCSQAQMNELGLRVGKIAQLLRNLTNTLRVSTNRIDMCIERLLYLSGQCRQKAFVVDATISTVWSSLETTSRFLNALFGSMLIERISVIADPKPPQSKLMPVKQISQVRGFLSVTVHACFYEKLQVDSSNSTASHLTPLKYRVTAELRHNGHAISDEKATGWRECDQMTMPLRLTFNEQLTFPEINSCVLPRETVIYFQFWCGKADTYRIGWACLGVFDPSSLEFVGNLCTNPGPNGSSNDIVLGLHSTKSKEYSSCSCHNLLSQRCPNLLVSIQISGPEAECSRIVFPTIEPRSDILLFDFDTLPEISKCQLRLILRRSNFSKFTSEEKQQLWEKRHYLTDFAGALPKVLRAIPNWDCLSLQDTYKLLKEWRRLSPAESIELLLPFFSDQFVRSIAVQSLKTLPVDNLEPYLPQLVRAWAFDFNPCSPLARLLLWSAATSPAFAHSLFWQLKQWISLDGDPWQYRYLLLAQVMYVVCSPRMIEEFKRENGLISDLDALSMRIKADRSLLNVEVEKLSLRLSNHPVRLPLKFSYSANGIDPNKCMVFSSLRAPVKLAFVHNPDSGSPELASSYAAIYKLGDDITQDIVVLQLIHIMDMIWQVGGLDLRLLVFHCVQTGYMRGIIQMVTDAQSLREIHVRYGLTGSFKTSAIDDWLKVNNPTPPQYQRAVENFTLSCAAYCVATFVLGVGDRHNDNIMLRKTGHLFHIDFGKYLGDSEMFGNFKRDRTAFVFTSDMAYVIYGCNQSSKRYQTFVNICCRAFNLLRHHSNILLTLLVMLQDTGIAGIDAHGVQFVKDVLRPDETDEESSSRFTTFLANSLQSRWTQINFFIHNVAQYKLVPNKSQGQKTAIPRRRTISNLLRHSDALKSDLKRKDFLSASLKSYGLSASKKLHYFKFAVRFDSVPEAFAFRTYDQLFSFSMKLHSKLLTGRFRLLPPGDSFVKDDEDSKYLTKTIPKILAVFEFLQSILRLLEDPHLSKVIGFFFVPVDKDLFLAESTDFHELCTVRDDATIVKDGLILYSKALVEGTPSDERYGTPRLKVSFSHAGGTLYILIMYGRNFASPSSAVPSTYVQVSLSPTKGEPYPARHTRSVHKASNPSYHELVMYRVPFKEAVKMHLIVQVFDSDSRLAQQILFVGETSLRTLADDGSSILSWIWLTAAPVLRIQYNSPI